MEEEELRPRFSGRTYSRSRQSRAFDEAASSKNVPVKAAMSLSKWGNAKIVPYRESPEEASDAKKMKMEVKEEDPFSFDTEDKRKTSPVKKKVASEAQPVESRFSTKLPASRINVNDSSGQVGNSQQPVIRTYSRTTPKKPVVMEQLSDKKAQLESASKGGLVKPMKSPEGKKLNKDGDSDDDIFPVQFKREPLKTYTGDVVTPVDKPDSPPPGRKSSYKRKGGPRGRKPLTVSDPGLIEEYKRNYAAQQSKLKPDTSTGGLNGSMVVSKKEVANSDQGTTLVVVCKPKGQIEKPSDVKTKYFSKSEPKHTLTPVVQDMSPSQHLEGKNGDSLSDTPVSGNSAAPTRSSGRLRGSQDTPDTSGLITSPGSAPSSASSVSSSTRVTRGRLSGLNSSKGASTDGSSQGEGSAGASSKRYRIFKSRTPKSPVVDNKPPVFVGDEDEEDPIPSSELEADPPVSDTQISEGGVDDSNALMETVSGVDPASQATELSSSQCSTISEPAVEIDIDPSGMAYVNTEKKVVLRGRRPVTVSDPERIEEYKQNYAAQQLKLTPDASTSGLNNSMVVSQKELSNFDQGTTLVVVCKPKGQDDSPFDTSDGVDPASQATELSSQCSASSEPVVEMDGESSSVKVINPSAARELLAARLRNMEKNNDSDSNGEQDNVSESSEGPPLSQESQPSSQKESSVTAPRRFFKSKKSLSGGSAELQRKIFSNSPQKSPSKATYNARSWYSEHETDSENLNESKKRTAQGSKEDVVLVKDSERGPKLKREVHWPERQYDEAYTSLKVNKTHKELYTVVHNVKQTHEVQELGETQDFIDDVNYLLESLRSTNSTSIRCLSCLSLAGKCISPAFRMHMRAHGTVTKIFGLLRDACTDPSLALSTSAMMFMLSRDRLNMDLDQDSLKLMLRLNEVDAGDKTSLGAAKLRDLEKTKQKVQQLLAELQQELQAREIDLLGFVSTGNLAMESLLSLTSGRAGEWFKEELRSAGGLDHIVDFVKSCEEELPDEVTPELTQKSLPVLRKLDRCLRVLENISFQNSDNQSYLISYKNASLIRACSRSLSLCQSAMQSNKVLEDAEENKVVKDLPGYTILTCMLAILRVMLNVSHEHKLVDLDSDAESYLMETTLKCLLCTQWCIPIEQRFDLAVLCLGLLINMVESCKDNRNVMMSLKTQVKRGENSATKSLMAVNAIVELFVQREAVAHEMEEDTSAVPADNSPNKSGEWRESDSGIQWITSSLQKAQEVVGKESQTPSKDDSILAPNKESEGNQSILEDDEETFTKALHKAGKHMENSIVASYAGLLLGTMIMDNKEYAATVKELMPNRDFAPMIKILKKFLNFMSLTTAFGSTDVNGITRVIDVLEAA